MREVDGQLFLDESRSPVRIPPFKGSVRDALLSHFIDKARTVSLRDSSIAVRGDLGTPERSRPR